MHDIKEIIKDQRYHSVSNQASLEHRFRCVYACDLLSAVIKHGIDSPILVTQINAISTLGVAVMLNLPAIILTEGKKFKQEIIDKANEEHICLIETDLTSTDVIIDLKQKNLL